MPILNVFRRDGERIRHFWGEELPYAPCDPGQDSRHNDLIARCGTFSTARPTGAAPTGIPS
jgi:hypothetical protein